jgi:DNA polymerase-3 subunit gamma/tau
MAKSLNCQKGQSATPCLDCTSCKEVKQVNSPAVIEIDAASHNSVDDARLLIERAPLVTVGGSNYKIYIIDECHMLTKEAFNALLKTIEEPPPNVIFILATTEEHKVPPTIISRCQRLMFKLINHDDLAVYLRHVATKENINIDSPAIDLIARRSGGGLRDALGLLDQASLLATTEKQVQLDDLLLLLGSVKEDVLLEFSKAIKEGAAEPVLQAAGSLLGEGREPALIALELSKHFLNLAKAQLKIPVLGSPSYLEALSEQSQLFDKTELAQMIEQLSALEQSCRRSTQSALTLEIGLLALCHRLEITELKQLKEKVNDLESRLASGTPLQAMPPQRPAARPPVTPQPHAATPAAAVSSAPAQPASPPVAAAAPAPPHAAPVSATAQATAPKANEHGADTSTTAVVTAEADSKNESSESSLPQENVIADTVITYEESEEAEPIAAVAYTEIDEVWSALLDQLQERHTPTYSLLQSMCTPLTLTRDELVIGVKEMLQKSLESKIEHIKSAAQAATGRDLQVKIKPITGTPEPKAKPKAPAAGISPGKPEAREVAAERPEVSAQSAAGSNEAQKPQNKHTPLSSAKPTKAPPGDPSEKGTLVKEAYRLFEGPGSREFADNS